MRTDLRRISIRLAVLTALAGCHGAGGEQSPGQLRSPGFFTKPVSFAILEDYDKGHDLAEIARDFTLFGELGIPVWRGSFGWDDYEPEPERYDFAWLDQFVSLADRMGISLQPYLGYTPEWAGRRGKDQHPWNDPPRTARDWARFAGAIAARLRSSRSLVSYEIYNEENVPLWWEGSAEEYAAILRAGARAIRRADPDVQILLGGMVWPDLEWLEVACRGGRAPFDVLPFHAYPETWTPDSITVERYLGQSFRRDFVPEADRLCGRKRIWMNEVGFATTPGTTERDQADWWIRAFATFLAEPRVEHLGIYEIRDQQPGTPVIGDAPNYYLGLVRRDGTPKLAFATVKLLVRLFGTDSITVADAALRLKVTEGEAVELYRHLFIRPDGHQLVFVWDRRGSPTVELELPRPATRVTTYTPAGVGTVWSDAKGRTIRGVKLEAGVAKIFETEP